MPDYIESAGIILLLGMVVMLLTAYVQQRRGDQRKEDGLNSLKKFEEQREVNRARWAAESEARIMRINEAYGFGPNGEDLLERGWMSRAMASVNGMRDIDRVKQMTEEMAKADGQPWPELRPALSKEQMDRLADFDRRHPHPFEEFSESIHQQMRRVEPATPRQLVEAANHDFRIGERKLNEQTITSEEIGIVVDGVQYYRQPGGGLFRTIRKDDSPGLMSTHFRVATEADRQEMRDYFTRERKRLDELEQKLQLKGNDHDVDHTRQDQGAEGPRWGASLVFGHTCQAEVRKLLEDNPDQYVQIDYYGPGYELRLVPRQKEVEPARKPGPTGWADHEQELRRLINWFGLTLTLEQEAKLKAPGRLLELMDAYYRKYNIATNQLDSMIHSNFTPGLGKGVQRHLNSTSYMIGTVDHKEPVEVFPKTDEEKRTMTAICTAEINWFIEYAKADGNFLNAKQVSDGYHTFQQLYDMRLALTIALFKSARRVERGVWRSRLHKDGTMFEGMFIVGITGWAPVGTPGAPAGWITFHYHDEHWDKFDFCDTLDKAPEYDGHTDKEVIERLMKL